MKNIIKMVLLASIISTPVIATIGLFGGISTVSMVNDVFAEKLDKEEVVKNSNNMDESTTAISLKNSSEKCTWWDPRC